MLEQAPISAADFDALAVATVKVLNSYNPEILVQAIKKYNEISKIRKGEYTLLDLLK